MGKFYGTLSAGLTQLDNELRAEASRSHMLDTILSGRWVHRAPLGYINQAKLKHLPRLRHDPERADLIRQMFERFVEGETSKADLKRHFTTLGLRTCSGKKLSNQDVSKMLKNRLYEGWIESERWGVSCKGDWEPLVSRETFVRVQAVLGNRAYKESKRNRDDPEFPPPSLRALRVVRQASGRQSCQGSLEAIPVRPLPQQEMLRRRGSTGARAQTRRRGQVPRVPWRASGGAGLGSANV